MKFSVEELRGGVGSDSRTGEKAIRDETPLSAELGHIRSVSLSSFVERSLFVFQLGFIPRGFSVPDKKYVSFHEICSATKLRFEIVGFIRHSKLNELRNHPLYKRVVILKVIWAYQRRVKKS